MPNCRLSKEKRKKIWGAMQLALLYVKQLKNINYGNSEFRIWRVDRCLLRIKWQKTSARRNGSRRGSQKHRENQNANKRAAYITKQK